MLQSRINVDWLTLDPRMFVPLFSSSKKAFFVMCSYRKRWLPGTALPAVIMVSLLLPGPMRMTKEVRACINMWPLQKTTHVVSNQMATEVFRRRERRRSQARHIWDKIEPVWSKIRNRVWSKQATGLRYDALFRCLFLHNYTEESRWLKRGTTGDGSNSSGRIVRHGLRSKPRGLRVNGSVPCISMDLISLMPWHGNGWVNMRTYLNRFGTHGREHFDANVHRT